MLVLRWFAQSADVQYRVGMRLFFSCCTLFALCAGLNAASLARPDDSNAFGARVCSLFPRGSGNITAWRGIGCTWHYVDGKALASSEAITLTAHRHATAEQISAYRNAEDGYIDGMAQYGLAKISPVNICGPSSGRKAIITASPELLMVSGYVICEGHYISADMKVKPGTGVDPSRLFDDLMPHMLPLIGIK